MNKKELRKELELTLVKTIEDVLKKRNTEWSIKTKKTIAAASKTIAKKFYKALKPAPKHVPKKAMKVLPTLVKSQKIGTTRSKPKIKK